MPDSEEVSDADDQLKRKKRAKRPTVETDGTMHLVEGDGVDPRAIVRVLSTDLDRAMMLVATQLSLDPSLYQRNGQLVSIAIEREHPYRHDERTRSTVTLLPGTPRIIDLSQAALTIRSTRWIRWQKFSEEREDFVDSRPDPAIIAGFCSCVASDATEHWERIRPLRGLRETPFLSPSGRIVTDAGYDSETRYVLAPSIRIEDVGDPTQEQAQEALRYLWTELYADFPFRGMGEPNDSRDNEQACARFELAKQCPDAFVSLSAILTIIARAAIDGAVMSVVFEANTQGAGKTLLSHIVSLVATGRKAGSAPYPTTRDGSTNDEEMSKALCGYARAGIALVSFDNVKGSIGGGSLEGAMTTADKASFRQLGTNDLVNVTWTALLSFTGNNMTMTEDIAQRVLLCRLESPREKPRDRPTDEMRHPNLLEWISENRSKLVRACLVILRSYMLSDRKHAGVIGSFEAWSRIVPAAIVYAGGANVLKAQPELEVVDSGESGAHSQLMRCWPTTLHEGHWKLSDLIKFVFERDHDERGHEVGFVHGELDDLREAIRALTGTAEQYVPNAKTLGNALRMIKGKWRDDLKLDYKKGHAGYQYWFVVSNAPPPIVAPAATESETAQEELFESDDLDAPPRF